MTDVTIYTYLSHCLLYLQLFNKFWLWQVLLFTPTCHTVYYIYSCLISSDYDRCYYLNLPVTLSNKLFNKL